MSKQLVSYVFNSPVLIPWKVVDGVSDEDMLETILLWQETMRDDNRFKEGNNVAEVDNPRQKMRIRRIIRKTTGEGDNKKHQLVGIECYWWQEAGEGVPFSTLGHRAVPGATPITED